MATRIYKTPFAATGDKEVLATADQPDGKVSLSAGWTPDYELPSDNPNYRPVGRAEMNGVINEVTEALGGVQLHGFATWQDIDGGWPSGAHVLSGDTVYRSDVNNNTTNPGTGGAGWSQPFAGRLLNVQVFPTAGTFTYTPTSGTRSIVVEVQGAGGAGGGSQATGASTVSTCPGGNAGAYGKSRIVTGFASVSVMVGAPGSGVLGASGGSGGASSFGALVSAPGGQGGQSYTAGAAPVFCINNSAQTSATGGNIVNASGGRGQPSAATSVTFGGSGEGGASVYGSGGRGIGVVATPTNGVAGVAPGSGGSGGGGGAGAGATTGGTGAPGIVIVWEYA